MEKPLRVLEIFNEFFGEDRVDMQGFPTLADVESVLSDTCTEDMEDILREYILNHSDNSIGGGFILVHFPHVRVANEYDKYVDIKHLFAKVAIDLEGKILGRFRLNRSEYTISHLSNNYMHSHIQSIPSIASNFQTPCTGNGPINRTICSLSIDFDEDLWRLFCLELDKFTQVESIAGTPYHRLESLTANGNSGHYNVYTKIRMVRNLQSYSLRCLDLSKLAQFTKCIIDNDILKFAYKDQGYYLAMSPVEYYAKISNLFIKWYNKEFKHGRVTHTLNDLLANNILQSVKFSNGGFIKEYNRNRIDYRAYEGAFVCKFKGNDVNIVISDTKEEPEQNNVIYLLNQDIANFIITKILNIINFRYGNNSERNSDGTPSKEVHFL